MDEKEKKTFSYIAVQRNDTEKIPKGTRVTFESEREVETSTGLMFRKEIAQACRDQLNIEVAANEEASIGTSFDVYSEARYATYRMKEEEKAEKQRQKDAMAEERRLQHEAELRRKELQRAKEEEKARQKKEAAAEKARQKTTTRKTTSRRIRSTSRSSKPVLGGFSLSNWKKSAKFIVTAIVVIWYLLTQVKSCSVNDVLQELGIPISIQMNDK